MSYYDDPQTFLNAQIASQNSKLADQLYTYRKVVTTISTTPIDALDTNIFNKAIELLGTIQFQKTVIQQLELQLNFIQVEPVLEEKSVVEQPVTEPVTEPVVEPLTEPFVEPLVDLSSNLIDLSSNLIDLSGNPS